MRERNATKSKSHAQILWQETCVHLFQYALKNGDYNYKWKQKIMELSKTNEFLQYIGNSTVRSYYYSLLVILKQFNCRKHSYFSTILT